jgi:hypothetical protein
MRGFRDRATDASLLKQFGVKPVSERPTRAAGIDGHSWAAEGRRQLFVWSGYTGSVDGCRLTYEG